MGRLDAIEAIGWFRFSSRSDIDRGDTCEGDMEAMPAQGVHADGFN